MRILLIAVPLALLAACNGGGGDNQATNAADANAADANTAAPAAGDNMSKPAGADAAAPANAMAAMDPARAGEIQECIADVQSEVPAGTDLNAFCGCAVDRMRTMGEEERPAMEACAAQMGIQPNN